MPWAPTAPIEIIAGTPAGGGQDRAARAFSGSIGFASTVLNVPGRGGGNGWAVLLDRPRDAHLIAVSSPTVITNRLLGSSNIDHTHLTPLAHLCTEYLVFAVASGSHVVASRRLVEALGTGMVVALATARGNVNHLATAALVKTGGGDPAGAVVRVFDTARDAVADLIAGGAEVAVVSAASVLPELTSGLIRVVAVTAPERLPGQFATTPTWAELGVDCTIGTWRGLIGPPGLDPEQVAFWDDVVALAVRTAEWRAALDAHLWTATHLDAAATGAFLDEERVGLTQALAELGLTNG